jgi:ligand-binding SRPBCC domain-containing protein
LQRRCTLGIQRSVTTHVLERRQLVRRPRPEVFAFFGDARNLEAITPDFLRFRIATAEPIAMATGTLIEYRLSLYGVPFGWQTRIEAWEPDRRFVDVQLRGPYRRWRHAHEFLEVPEGTLMLDRVEYALPLGPLGSLAHALLVRRALDAIFDHRRERIAALLPPSVLRQDEVDVLGALEGARLADDAL